MAALRTALSAYHDAALTRCREFLVEAFSPINVGDRQHNHFELHFHGHTPSRRQLCAHLPSGIMQRDFRTAVVTGKLGFRGIGLTLFGKSVKI